MIASRVRCLPLFESVSFKLLAFTNYLQGHPKMPEQNWKWIDLPSLCLCNERKRSRKQSFHFVLGIKHCKAYLLVGKIDITAVQHVIASRVRYLPLFESLSFKLLAFTNYLQGHPKMPEQNWKWIDLSSLCLYKKRKRSRKQSFHFVLGIKHLKAYLLVGQN